MAFKIHHSNSGNLESIYAALPINNSKFGDFTVSATESGNGYYFTIQDAIDAAIAAGETSVIVSPGTYADNILITNDISIIGIGKVTVSGVLTVTDCSANITSITFSPSDDVTPVILNCTAGSENVSFDHCNITSNDTSALGGATETINATGVTTGVMLLSLDKCSYSSTGIAHGGTLLEGGANFRFGVRNSVLTGGKIFLEGSQSHFFTYSAVNAQWNILNNTTTTGFINFYHCQLTSNTSDATDTDPMFMNDVSCDQNFKLNMTHCSVRQRAGAAWINNDAVAGTFSIHPGSCNYFALNATSATYTITGVGTTTIQAVHPNIV